MRIILNKNKVLEALEEMAHEDLSQDERKHLTRFTKKMRESRDKLRRDGEHELANERDNEARAAIRGESIHSIIPREKKNIIFEKPRAIKISKKDK